MRALFQVLVIPHRATARTREYAVLLRRVESYWQWVAGGGEDDEGPMVAAQRELTEELGSPNVVRWWPLGVVEQVPTTGLDLHTRDDVPETIPEYAFAAELDPAARVTLSDEHADVAWVSYQRAVELLHWSSNVRALDQLKYQLTTEAT